MAASDEFRTIALLSHELRAPMGVLSGYLKLLAREAALSERQQTLVRNALAAGDKLHALLADLRELLEIEAGELRLERRPVPLQTLAADLAAAAPSWPEAPSLEVGPLPNVVLQVDRTRLVAALAALVRAAARPQGQGALVHLSGTLDDRAAVRLSVSSGERATAEVPETPLDESRGGLGLALPLARAIVGAHGGVIAEQAPAMGALTFAVVLATTG